MGKIVILLALLATPAAAAESDDIWEWIWRERAELRAERAARAESEARTARRPTLSERRAARKRAASRLVAQRALDRRGCCAPARRYVIVRAERRERGCVVRVGRRVFVDLDGDGRHDPGEPSLVVEE